MESDNLSESFMKELNDIKGMAMLQSQYRDSNEFTEVSGESDSEDRPIETSEEKSNNRAKTTFMLPATNQ